MSNVPVPSHPKIYHIAHVDRLPSIVADGFLWCDAEVIRREPAGTTIGMSSIKQRRLTLPLSSYPDLHVGDCVPFYFCPRSVMLYLIHRGNHPELDYRGGKPRSCISKPICMPWRLGHTYNRGGGPSPSRTLVRASSRTDAIWHVSTKSTGRPFKPGIGGPARKASKLSFWWSTPLPGT